MVCSRIADLWNVHENRIPWFGQEVLPMNGVFAQTVVVPHRYHEHSKRRYTATMEIMCMTMRTNTTIHQQGAEIARKIPERKLGRHVFGLVHVYFVVHSRGNVYQSTLRVSEQ